jgi:hypothetical protein
MDHAIPVFWYALPRYMQNDLKRLEKELCPLSCMPEEIYSDTLNLLGIPSLKDHHEHLCDKLFQSTVSDSKNRIHNLLPDKNEFSYNLRHERSQYSYDSYE